MRQNRFAIMHYFKRVPGHSGFVRPSSHSRRYAGHRLPTLSVRFRRGCRYRPISVLSPICLPNASAHPHPCRCAPTAHLNKITKAYRIEWYASYKPNGCSRAYYSQQGQ